MPERRQEPDLSQSTSSKSTTRRRPKAAPVEQAPPRPSGEVVPFAARSPRRFRRTPAEGETYGQILLFLGVRYERTDS